MSSSRRHHRSGYRFGFEGKRLNQDSHGATTDEILDSLTRRASLMQKDREERTLELQAILEVEPNEDTTRPSGFKPSQTFEHVGSRNLGGYAFAAMLIGGLAFLWLYGRFSQSLSLQSLLSLQETISRAGFADWQKVVLIALSAITIALISRHSRNKRPSRLPSTI